MTAGHESLATASEAIAAEFDAVAERMVGTLETRQADRAAEGSPEPA